MSTDTSAFINKPEADRAKILNTKIVPLLYKYYQINSATVKNILSEADVTLKSTGVKENFQIRNDIYIPYKLIIDSKYKIRSNNDGLKTGVAMIFKRIWNLGICGKIE